MNLTAIIYFFYKRASDRIKNRILSSPKKLTLKEIHPDDKLIRNIINLKFTRQNRYLIPDYAMKTYYKDPSAEHKYIPCGLLETPELYFTNRSEILWGTKSEIKTYLKDLFTLLWTEISEDYETYKIQTELYLLDYVPYAKYSTYWNILFSPNNPHPAIAYGVMEDDIIQNIDSAREAAFDYFYQKCCLDFELSFLFLSQKTETFRKINKAIENFIFNEFIPILQKHAPTASSLGLRVQSMIINELIHCADLAYSSNIYNRSNARQQIYAASQYIMNLENLKQYI